MLFISIIFPIEFSFFQKKHVQLMVAPIAVLTSLVNLKPNKKQSILKQLNDIFGKYFVNEGSTLLIILNYISVNTHFFP